MKIIKSATLNEIDAKEVFVEITFTKGLPGFTIVGMISTVINEAKDRTKAALLTNEYKFPPLKITVNLSPSEIKKSGTHFDLPIALLICLYDKKVNFSEFHIFGELSLNGTIKDSSAIFPIVLSLTKQNKIRKVLVCKNSALKLSKIPNIVIYCVENLCEAIDFFSSNEQEKYLFQKEVLSYEKIIINSEEFFYVQEYLLDFSEIKGQEIAKKAAIIAAAGCHNILLEGSPGSGKTMIAKRIPYVMTPMSLDEILQHAKIESLELKEPNFKPMRVFRSPHCTSSKASIIGGNHIGEIALADSGVLFFDELPHFSSSILEALREPLEDNKLLVSRANSKFIYSTKFLFIGACNPCPCGNLLSHSKTCRCNELEIKRYKNRLSDPFLDRIDLYVLMHESNFDDQTSYTSLEIHAMVIHAFTMQKLRGQKELNGKLGDDEIKRYCTLDAACQEILEKATIQFALSFRSINKILKVSRTIADLQSSVHIKKHHLLEALSYRRR